MSEKQRITVIGDGAMASVCALLLHSNGHNVTMWGPFAEHIEQLKTTHRNDKYLKGHPMPADMQFTADESTAADNADLFLCAIPTQFVRPVFERFATHIKKLTPIVSVSKGVEIKTLLRPSQVIGQMLGRNDAQCAATIAALSGPSIASELANHQPATLCAAGKNIDLINHLQTLFTTNWMRVYTNRDLVGVELAGATKNVIAIAAGILDGLKAGYNAKSALLARGLSEITRLGTAMGALPETFFGVTGVGDLATTCFCPEGRNRTCGELLGQGLGREEAQAKIHGVVEGIATTQSVMQLATLNHVEMPITHAVHEILFNNLSPTDAIANLMSREPKEEKVG